MSTVKSPTSTEVKSPTRTSTSTEAQTDGNITVTGGAGRGATTRVIVHQLARPSSKVGRKLSSRSSRGSGRR